MNRLAERNFDLWTDGTVHEMAPGAPLVTDPELIAFERACAAEAEAQDAAGEGSAEARASCALRVDFLVALTFELNLWKWSTRKVLYGDDAYRPFLILNFCNSSPCYLLDSHLMQRPHLSSS